VRQTSYQLFGYRLEVESEDQYQRFTPSSSPLSNPVSHDNNRQKTIYRIRSMYSEDEGEFFLFKSTKEGIEMLETKFR
jgi:hypothetical protein